MILLMMMTMIIGIGSVADWGCDLVTDTELRAWRPRICFGITHVYLQIVEARS